MGRKNLPRASRPNIPCSFCKIEFFPDKDDKWDRWRQGKPTYCSWVCVKDNYAVEAHLNNPDQPCTICGEIFKLSRSQRNKKKSRSDTGLYCSTECLYVSRSRNHPNWKHGLYSSVSIEVGRLRTKIKKLIHEGATT